MKQLVITLIALAALAATAQEARVAFADPVAFEQSCDNSPGVVRAAIEANCDQATVDAIEAAVIPPASDEEKKQLLEQAEQLLRRAEQTAIADTVATEREKLPVVEEPTEPVKER